MKVTDYIRFFSTTYDYNCIRKAIVFPQKKDGSFRAVDYQNEEDEFVLSFEETDNTEVLDLREFADGDSVNKIHWKLSMNSDDFIVRQYLSLIHISEPTRRTPISYAVFCLKKKT